MAPNNAVFNACKDEDYILVTLYNGLRLDVLQLLGAIEPAADAIRPPAHILPGDIWSLWNWIVDSFNLPIPDSSQLLLEINDTLLSEHAAATTQILANDDEDDYTRCELHAVIFSQTRSVDIGMDRVLTDMLHEMVHCACGIGLIREGARNDADPLHGDGFQAVLDQFVRIFRRELPIGAVGALLGLLH